MPLQSIPADQAFTKLRRSPRSLWPDGRRGSKRLQDIATVEFDPSFELKAGEAVMTIGSCFARNIEWRLEELGFDVPARAVKLPVEERASRAENELLNKYVPHSILNELRWAFDPAHPFPDAAYLRAAGGWMDPHLAPSVSPADLGRVKERRAMVQAFYRQLARCRIVVLTMGLVEAWFDEEIGLYMNGAPPAPAIRREPHRFRLDILSFAEIRQALDEILVLLKAHAAQGLRVLITVSPVPLNATFTGQDVITANSYSKSVLRAAVEEFVRANPEVDYFPSYEIVTHTARTSAFTQDDRHVANRVVHTIVDRVAAAYAGVRSPVAELESITGEAAPAEGETPQGQDVRRKLREAMRAGRDSEAIGLLAALDRPGGWDEVGMDEARFRHEYGGLLLRKGLTVRAEAQLARAAALIPNGALVHHALGTARSQLQRYREAEDAFRTAAELAPDEMLLQWRFAREMIRNGKAGEAEQLLLRCLADHPEEERLTALLAEARRAEARSLLRWEEGAPDSLFGGPRSLFGRLGQLIERRRTAAKTG